MQEQVYKTSVHTATEAAPYQYVVKHFTVSSMRQLISGHGQLEIMVASVKTNGCHFEQ